MIRLAGPVRTPSGLTLTTTRWRSPVIAIQALAATAWVSYASILATAQAQPARHEAAIWWCMPGMTLGGHASSGPLTAMIAGAPMWSVMALAMTLPAAIPAAQYVAVNSLRHRQWIAVGEYLAAYLGLWLLFGLSAIAALALLPATSRDLMLAGALASAAAWELTPLKRLALNRCHRGSPLRPRGLPASATVLRFAWINTSACIGSCWLAMVAMLLATSAQIEWALGLTALMVYVKMTRTPRRAVLRTATALALAATGVAAGLLAGGPY